ncbi:MAG: tRNA (adenine(22)-N(1))-methyltransferase [Rubripirellula sp.]
MPHLDLRLKTVAKQIHAECHADVGSDHGNLLVALLKTGRIKTAIAVENKRQPFENSRRALLGLKGEARFADGLKGLAAGEADSLSICGMGGASIVSILQADPDRIPPKIVLQPNRGEELVRRWAISNDFHLVEEQIAWGHWPYAVLTYRSGLGKDPAYANDHREAALMFGPFNIRRCEPKFVEQLVEEHRYLRALKRLNNTTHRRLEMIEHLLHQKQLYAPFKQNAEPSVDE